MKVNFIVTDIGLDVVRNIIARGYCDGWFKTAVSKNHSYDYKGIIKDWEMAYYATLPLCEDIMKGETFSLDNDSCFISLQTIIQGIEDRLGDGGKRSFDSFIIY